MELRTHPDHTARVSLVQMQHVILAQHVRLPVAGSVASTTLARHVRRLVKNNPPRIPFLRNAR